MIARVRGGDTCLEELLDLLVLLDLFLADARCVRKLEIRRREVADFHRGPRLILADALFRRDDEVLARLRQRSDDVVAVLVALRLPFLTPLIGDRRPKNQRAPYR